MEIKYTAAQMQKIQEKLLSEELTSLNALLQDATETSANFIEVDKLSIKAAKVLEQLGYWVEWINPYNYFIRIRWDND